MLSLVLLCFKTNIFDALILFFRIVSYILNLIPFVETLGTISSDSVG